MLYDRDELKATLMAEEGLRLDAYWDPIGQVWTIGYGHTGKNIVQGMTITKMEADAWLDDDITEAQRQLATALPWATALSDVRIQALLQMTFQLGINGLLKFRHMVEALRVGAWDRAYSEAMDSDWARQTPARAQRVAGMLRDGV